AFQLARRLAEQLPQGVLTLEAPVHAVVQSDTGVTVRHARGEVRAGRLIVALAPALAARIDFQPALPAARLQLQTRMPMGSVIKALVAYERPFWRED
ncbi:FAD-dependent oxidoreductase, partial [Acinetobacter baumannii]